MLKVHGMKAHEFVTWTWPARNVVTQSSRNTSITIRIYQRHGKSNLDNTSILLSTARSSQSIKSEYQNGFFILKISDSSFESSTKSWRTSKCVRRSSRSTSSMPISCNTNIKRTATTETRIYWQVFEQFESHVTMLISNSSQLSSEDNPRRHRFPRIHRQQLDDSLLPSSRLHAGVHNRARSICQTKR